MLEFDKDSICVSESQDLFEPYIKAFDAFHRN